VRGAAVRRSQSNGHAGEEPRCDLFPALDQPGFSRLEESLLRLRVHDVVADLLPLERARVAGAPGGFAGMTSMRHGYSRMGYCVTNTRGIFNCSFRVSKLEYYRARIILSRLRVVDLFVGSVHVMQYINSPSFPITAGRYHGHGSCRSFSAQWTIRD
jgi:hypothetical protein